MGQNNKNPPYIYIYIYIYIYMINQKWSMNQLNISMITIYMHSLDHPPPSPFLKGGSKLWLAPPEGVETEKL